VRAKCEDRSFFRLRNIQGVQKFRNWVTYPRPRPLRGQFVVWEQELPTAYVRAKFEDRSFFRLRNIEGSQNFEIGSRTPGHAHLGANNCGPGQELPTAYVVPNLKGVALSVCKILAHFAAMH